jgi:hypothetical protein
MIPDSILKIAATARVEKRTYAKTWHQDELLEKLTKEANVKLLGRGAYSVVITHPEDKKKVIKITLSAKDGYHKYVKWVMRNSDLFPRNIRKHLPKVFHTVEYKGTRITILERLRHGDIDSQRTTEEFDDVEKIIRMTAPTFEVQDDGGGRNIMFRGKTPVITDPWSHIDY